MSEIDRWLANLELELSGASLNPLEGFVLGGDVFNLTELRGILTQAKEARRQALEEAAKVAARWEKFKWNGIDIDDARDVSAQIAQAIRALASDSLLDRDSPSPPPVV